MYKQILGLNVYLIPKAIGMTNFFFLSFINGALKEKLLKINLKIEKEQR